MYLTPSEVNSRGGRIELRISSIAPEDSPPLVPPSWGLTFPGNKATSVDKGSEAATFDTAPNEARAGKKQAQRK